MGNKCCRYNNKNLGQFISGFLFSLALLFLPISNVHAMYARTRTNQERVIVLFDAFNRGSLVVPPMPDNLPVGVGWLSKDENAEDGFDHWRIVDSPSYGPFEGAAHSNDADNMESYLSIRHMDLKGLTDAHLSFKLYSDTNPGPNPLGHDEYLLVRIRYWDNVAKQIQEISLFDSREALAAGTLVEETWADIEISLPLSVNGSDDVDIEFIYLTGPGGLFDFNGPGVAIDNVTITAMDGYDINSTDSDSIISYSDDSGQNYEITACMKYNPVKPGENNKIPFLEYDLSAIESLNVTIIGPDPVDEKDIAVDLFEVLSRGRHVDRYTPADWIDENDVVDLNVGSGVVIDFPVKQGVFRIFENVSAVESSLVYGKLALDSFRKGHYSELFLGMLLQSDLLKDPYIMDYINAGNYGAPALPELLDQYREALNVLSVDPNIPPEEQFSALLQGLQEDHSTEYNAMGDVGNLLSMINNIKPADVVNLLGEGVEKIPAVSWLANLATGLNIGRSLMSSFFTMLSNSSQLEDKEAKQIAMKLVIELFFDQVGLANRISAFESVLAAQGSTLDPMLLEAWKTAKIQALACKFEEVKFTFDDLADRLFSIASHVNNAASIIEALGMTGWGSHLAAHIGLSHGALVTKSVHNVGDPGTALAIYTAITYYKFFTHIEEEADILVNGALSYNLRQLLLDSHTELVNQLSQINSTHRTLQNYRLIRNLYGMHGYLCWRDIAALQSDEYDSFVLDLVSSWTTADTYVAMLDAYRARFATDLLDTILCPSSLITWQTKLTSPWTEIMME